MGAGPGAAPPDGGGEPSLEGSDAGSPPVSSATPGDSDRGDDASPSTAPELRAGSLAMLAIFVLCFQAYASPRALAAGLARARPELDWRAVRTVALALGCGCTAAYAYVVRRKAPWPPATLAAFTRNAVIAFSALMLVAGMGDGDAHTSMAMLFLGGLVAGQQRFFFALGGGPQSQQAATCVLSVCQAWSFYCVPFYLAVAAFSPDGLRSFPVACKHGVAAAALVLHALISRRRLNLRNQSVTHYDEVLYQLRQEEENNDSVLSLLLPRTVMDSLKETTHSVCFAEAHPEASILFVEIADFSEIVTATPAATTLELLNSVFWEFDVLTTHAELLKVETVGPVYMVAAGIPTYRLDHEAALGHLALEMRECLKDFSALGRPLQAKFGIHCGPVIGGVVGVKLPRYRLFGDVVNTAARMETHAPPGGIQLSEAAARAIRMAIDRPQSEFRDLVLTSRGMMTIKSKGEVRTFLLERRHAPARGPPRAKAAAAAHSHAPALAADADEEAPSDEEADWVTADPLFIRPLGSEEAEAGDPGRSGAGSSHSGSRGASNSASPLTGSRRSSVGAGGSRRSSAGQHWRMDLKLLLNTLGTSSEVGGSSAGSSASGVSSRTATLGRARSIGSKSAWAGVLAGVGTAAPAGWAEGHGVLHGLSAMLPSASPGAAGTKTSAYNSTDGPEGLEGPRVSLAPGKKRTLASVPSASLIGESRPTVSSSWSWQQVLPGSQPLGAAGAKPSNRLPRVSCTFSVRSNRSLQGHPMAPAQRRQSKSISESELRPAHLRAALLTAPEEGPSPIVLARCASDKELAREAPKSRAERLQHLPRCRSQHELEAASPAVPMLTRSMSHQEPARPLPSPRVPSQQTSPPSPPSPLSPALRVIQAGPPSAANSRPLQLTRPLGTLDNPEAEALEEAEMPSVALPRRATASYQAAQATRLRAMLEGDAAEAEVAAAPLAHIRDSAAAPRTLTTRPSVAGSMAFVNRASLSAGRPSLSAGRPSLSAGRPSLSAGRASISILQGAGSISFAPNTHVPNRNSLEERRSDEWQEVARPAGDCEASPLPLPAARQQRRGSLPSFTFGMLNGAVEFIAPVQIWRSSEGRTSEDATAVVETPRIARSSDGPALPSAPCAAPEAIDEEPAARTRGASAAGPTHRKKCSPSMDGAGVDGPPELPMICVRAYSTHAADVAAEISARAVAPASALTPAPLGQVADSPLAETDADWQSTTRENFAWGGPEEKSASSVSAAALEVALLEEAALQELRPEAGSGDWPTASSALEPKTPRRFSLSRNPAPRAAPPLRGMQTPDQQSPRGLKATLMLGGTTPRRSMSGGANPFVSRQSMQCVRPGQSDSGVGGSSRHDGRPDSLLDSRGGVSPRASLASSPDSNAGSSFQGSSLRPGAAPEHEVDLDSSPRGGSVGPHLAPMETETEMNPLWLCFQSPETEAAFVADRLEMKHGAALTSLKIGGATCLTFLLLLTPTAPALAWRHASLLLMLVAVTAGSTTICHVLIDRLMSMLYDPAAGLTLKGVRGLVQAQFFGSFWRIVSVSVWAAATNQIQHMAPTLAIVACTNVGQNILLFDAYGSLMLGIAVTVCHLALLASTQLAPVWWHGDLGSAGAGAAAGACSAGGSAWWEVLIGMCLLAIAQAHAYHASWAHEKATRRNHVLQMITQHRRNISQYLISNMLPQEVIAEIRRCKRTSIDVRRGDTQLLAWTFPTVHLLQSDIVGFTKLGSRISAEELCRMLHDLFSSFDELSEENDVYKIETIGDAYLAATGCVPGSSGKVVTSLSCQHDARRIARLAIALQEHCRAFVAPDGSVLRMRIGLVTGPALGGVVGASMLRYHLFGNLTSEVTCYEQSAPEGGILCSAGFRDALLGLTRRGGVPVPHKVNSAGGAGKGADDRLSLHRGDSAGSDAGKHLGTSGGRVRRASSMRIDSGAPGANREIRSPDEMPMLSPAVPDDAFDRLDINSALSPGGSVLGSSARGISVRRLSCGGLGAAAGARRSSGGLPAPLGTVRNSVSLDGRPAESPRPASMEIESCMFGFRMMPDVLVGGASRPAYLLTDTPL